VHISCSENLSKCKVCIAVKLNGKHALSACMYLPKTSCSELTFNLWWTKGQCCLIKCTLRPVCLKGKNVVLQWEFKLNSAEAIVEHWHLDGHVLNVSLHITSQHCYNFICMYKTVNKNHHACVLSKGGCLMSNTNSCCKLAALTELSILL
jgi:hypothetical protein